MPFKSPKTSVVKTYKLEISYLGTNFKGWQSQAKGERTVQGLMHDILSDVFESKVKTMAASRTDAGVHALGQVLHFKGQTNIASPKLKTVLNSKLPEDIMIQCLEEAPETFHACYAAKSKCYEYQLAYGAERPVFEVERSAWIPQDLNVANMQKASQNFLGEHDFTSFCSPAYAKENRLRSMTQVDWDLGQRSFKFQIHGNGFMHHMVRIMVGTLIEIGQGKRPEGDVPRILLAKDRREAGKTAPSKGLTLVKVYY